MGQAQSYGSGGWCCRRNILTTSNGDVLDLTADSFEDFELLGPTDNDNFETSKTIVTQPQRNTKKGKNDYSGRKDRRSCYRNPKNDAL
ncbi:UL11 [anatid alphaherpesvirus 1]|uniref:UL11 n=1 Tax=anatid alphaherpesvirus 1 TaxID=104388 RepID=A5A411_9ALPH|nr:UL11 [Anatid alphaherpesvirus 1]YP_010795366.1 UL11 [Anatid alphaherpesvirus 1]AHD45972.1 UL11 [BAC cloning vector pDEV-vac]QWQ49784.1 UL11 [BAC cloning vector pDEV-CHa]ABP88834.1 UL11 [Anatid alphaherpesvirus 1]ACF75341.1 UL11 protein [Anatid alphaherpesvirus 1]ACT83564.1 UL11 [Anatid alphaherpesvirus 1]